jgi:hypothetical protein
VSFGLGEVAFTSLRSGSAATDTGSTTDGLAALDRRRRKLLELHYADQISAELFGQQEREIAEQIEMIRHEGELHQAEMEERDTIAARFEQVAAILRDLDFDQQWLEATDQERRTLVEEMVEQVVVFPDHLEVVIYSAPKLNVTLAEVGLGSQSQNVDVEWATRALTPRVVLTGDRLIIAA